MTKIFRGLGIGAVLCGPLFAAPAHAILVDGAGQPLAIPGYRFQSGEDGAVNPSYTYTGVPGYGDITISYGPFFDGQAASDAFSPPISTSGVPHAPLALTSFIDPGTGTPDLQTIVEIDGGNPVPGTEVLGGLPFGFTNGFGGPIAILFSTPVAGVTLNVGDLSTVGSTTIDAFAASGDSLGGISNSGTGYETFNLTDNGGRPIGGLLLSSTEPAGFGIDDVGVFALPLPLPAPGALALLPCLGVLAAARRRRPR
jgi:hypothetical protein